MKGTRQTEILRIVEEQVVETQDQLLAELKKRGVDSTQATMSRDIKQLHLIKELTATGTYKYVVSDQKKSLNFASRLKTIFREGVISFDMAQNIVVINTMPGLASAACAALDSMDIPNMIGSLAGDDTAFILMRDNRAATEFSAEIARLLK
ncbi:MAG: arginine repressor [Oscillospiraceae bacterium]